MSQQDPRGPRFFLTSPTPCPYLEDHQERKIFTHLPSFEGDEFHQVLAENGFRRSQSLVYRPSCEGCTQCKSVRVVAPEFTASSRFRRVKSKNADVYGIERPASTTTEQYELFQTYLAARHADGGMTEMSPRDYCYMVEDSPIDTMLVEYYQRTGVGDERLIGVALTDRMADGLSMVYSFYDPELHSRSLGTFMILDHIERVATERQRHLYLGYWVKGSRKMSYKIQFEPMEVLSEHHGWQPFSPRSAD